MELEFIHPAILTLTALVILFADHRGFQYFKGVRTTLDRDFITWSHRLVWVGLIGMIISGFFLMLPRWEHFVSEPAFIVKMVFVLTLCVNALFIGRLAHVASVRSFRELTKNEQKTFIISGGVSAVGWLGAAIIGLAFL